MGPRVMFATLACWLLAATEAIAQGNSAFGKAGGNGNHGGHGGHGAPEIDGPAGIAALALLIGAGLLVYNRFKK